MIQKTIIDEKFILLSPEYQVPKSEMLIIVFTIY